MLYPLSYEGMYGSSPSTNEVRSSQHNLSTTLSDDVSTSLSCHPLFSHVDEPDGPAPTKRPRVTYAHEFAMVSER